MFVLMHVILLFVLLLPRVGPPPRLCPPLLTRQVLLIGVPTGPLEIAPRRVQEVDQGCPHPPGQQAQLSQLGQQGQAVRDVSDSLFRLFFTHETNRI
jgi:hypothetical protein